MPTEPLETTPEPPGETPEERAEAIARLKRAIELSGLSDRRFAKEVLIRDERTIRRWIAGDRAIPQAVRDKVTQLLEAAPNAEGKERSRRG